MGNEDSSNGHIIGLLKDINKNIDNRFNEVKEEIKSVNEILEKLGKKMYYNDLQITALDSKYNNFTVLVGTVNGTLTERVDAMNKRFEDVEKRHSEIDRKYAEGEDSSDS